MDAIIWLECDGELRGANIQVLIQAPADEIVFTTITTIRNEPANEKSTRQEEMRENE